MSLNYAKCENAMYTGAIHPNPGENVTLLKEDGNTLECYMENMYGNSNACPTGWYGKADDEMCFKVNTERHTNEESARYTSC